jgi:hypothetical protein
MRSLARALTDEVTQDAAALWAKLLRLYEGEAHIALGYSSWGAYYEKEFQSSKSQRATACSTLHASS